MKFVMTCLLFMANGSVASSAVHFAPEIVELTGRLEQQTFPGLTGYASIKEGDEAERGWYLRLSESISVRPNKPPVDPNERIENNVKILQMVLDPEKLEVWKALKVAKKVRVKGTLFVAWTGHHHSRVLIEVDQVSEARQ